MRKTIIAALILLLHQSSILAAALPPQTLQSSWNVEAKGQLRCNGVPMAHVQVDLMWSQASWTDIWDSTMASAVTDDDGRWQLRGAGGSIFGPPAPYARAVYLSTVGDPAAPQTRVEVTNEAGSIRSDHMGTRDFPWALGVINMGVLDFDTDDCRLWINADRAGWDYKDEIEGAVPLYRQYDILHWSAFYIGSSFSALDTTYWPTNYGVTPVDVFHEFGHTIRHSLDGDFGHWFGDVTRFGYLREHHVFDVTNEGFAFNEGWAEMWETRWTRPPRGRKFINVPANWSVEGDVAADLRRVADCIGWVNMVVVLRDNPAAIHSRDEFWAAVRRKFPRACDPPTPPDPTPGGCASGMVTQQFYDGMVGCAGKVIETNAATLCGKGFKVCTPQQWVDSHRHLKPAHHYWLNGPLDESDYLMFCAARPVGTGTMRCDDWMHVCVPGTTKDPEGNSCGFLDCIWNPPPGEEFPVDQFFGGCTFGDTTAGTLCCQEKTLTAPHSGPAAWDALAVQTAPATRDKAEDRALLVEAVGALQKCLAAARQAAVLPEACPQEAGCGPALTALIEPPLLEGTIDLYHLYLSRLDAAPSSIAELQQRAAAGGGLAKWVQDYRRSYVSDVLTIEIDALHRAVAALGPALASPAFADAARHAADDANARIAALEEMRRNPDHASGIPAFEPDKWPMRHIAASGKR